MKKPFVFFVDNDLRAVLIYFPQADVAQSVERRLGKAEVTGPIPVISLKPTPFTVWVFCFQVYKNRCLLLQAAVLFLSHDDYLEFDRYVLYADQVVFIKDDRRGVL